MLIGFGLVKDPYALHPTHKRMAKVMRIAFDIPHQVVTAALDYISRSTADGEMRIKVRLVQRAIHERQPLNLLWEVEMLPNNGGIYRILLEGGQDEKGVHDNQG